MAKEENFFERNKGLLNATGHATNALQNYKIQENQRELAKATLVNASLQKENQELQEKKFSMLEKQLAAEEEAKLVDKQNKFLKKLMYEALPDLEDLIDQIKNSEISKADKTENYFKARILLRFISDNRGLIEDIEYHRGLKSADKNISEMKEANFIDLKTLEELSLFSMKEALLLFEAIQLLLKVSNGQGSSDMEALKNTKKVFFDYHFDPMGAAALSESLEVANEHNFKVNNISLDTALLNFIHHVNGKIGDRQFIKNEVEDFLKIELYKNSIKILENIENYLEQFVVNKKRIIITEETKKIDHERVYTNVKIIKETLGSIEVLDNESLQKRLDYWSYSFLKKNAEKYIDYINVRIHLTLRGNPEDFENELKKTLEPYFQGKNISGEYFYLLSNFYNHDGYFAGNNHLEAEKACFVVTVTTGSPDNKIVNDFREYRDTALVQNTLGRVFINTYYKIAPYIADFISDKPLLKKVILKGIIEPLHKNIKQ